MTETLLRAAIVNAALALLLAVPAALASRFLRRRPAVAHALWLLVLLKLVTPPMLEVPLFRAGEEPAAPSFPAQTAGLCCTREPDPGPRLEQAPSQPSLALRALPEVEPTTAPFDWRAPLLGAWLAGAAGVWWLALARLGRLERLLAQLPPANGDLQDRVRRLSDRLGLRRTPRLWLVPGVVPPLLVACGRAPRLLVPAGLWARLDDDQRDALLLHELAHLRRGDPLVRLLELAVVGLFWWYPLAWWAGRALRDAEELCCDAWVVWAAPGSAGAYAGALVETVGFLSGAKAALPLVASGAAPVRFLHRRLSMILRHPPSRRLSPVALVALVAGGLLVLPAVPGLARTEPAADGPAPTIQRLIADSPSCRGCHQPAKPASTSKDFRGDAKTPRPENLHQEIIAQLAELEAARARVAMSEKTLRVLIERFEKATGARPDAAKGSDKRLDDLEKKLEGILKELQQMRRERGPSRSALPATSGRDVVYLNRRSFQIPIRVSRERRDAVRQLMLIVSRDEGATWEVCKTAASDAKSFEFAAERDGRYQFRVEAVDAQGRVDRSGDRGASMIVHVDTVRPEVELTLQKRTGETVVTWRIIEENPDLKTMKLEYRLVGGGTWGPLPTGQRLSGVAAFHHAGEVAEVRMRVADLAGNSVEGKVGSPAP